MSTATYAPLATFRGCLQRRCRCPLAIRCMGTSSALPPSSSSSAPSIVFGLSAATDACQWSSREQDKCFPGHDMEGHPECAARVHSIREALTNVGYRLSNDSLQRADEAASATVRTGNVMEVVRWEPAPNAIIELAHDERYVRGLEQAVAKMEAGKITNIEGSGPTYGTRNTHEMACQSAGLAIAIADQVFGSQSEVQSTGFCIARPPGHHAVPKGPMGFCVFDNVAIVARHLQAKYNLQRVMIFDFDVHHGNGTQDIFYEDGSVLCISVHQEMAYPGTGPVEETGAGNGEGGSGEFAICEVFDTIVAEAAQRFRPDVILVAAGYDAHWRETLAQFQYKTGTYHWLSSRIQELARELCNGRVMYVLEGGYDLTALGASVADTFRGILGESSEDVFTNSNLYLYDEPLANVRTVMNRVKAVHGL